MKADLKKIKWLLENQTAYSISKATGISQTTLGPYKLGNRDYGKMSLQHAIKLTDYANELLRGDDNVDDSREGTPN